MAGTRLWIQSIVLIKLVLIIAFSFHLGLCGFDDELCTLSSFNKVEKPKLEDTSLIAATKTIIHVSSSTETNHNFDVSTISAQIKTVDPDESTTTMTLLCNHDFTNHRVDWSQIIESKFFLWICPSQKTTKTNTSELPLFELVIHNGITIVHPKDTTNLHEILNQLYPTTNMISTWLLTMTLYIEQGRDDIQQWAHALTKWMWNNNPQEYWPCISKVDTKLIHSSQKSFTLPFVQRNRKQAQKEYEKQLLLQEYNQASSNNEETENKSVQLQSIPLSLRQLEMIMNQIASSNEIYIRGDNYDSSPDPKLEIIIYVPSTLPLELQKPSSISPSKSTGIWEVNSNTLVALIANDLANDDYISAVEQILTPDIVSTFITSRALGLSFLDQYITVSDSSFPKYYWTWWHIQLAQDLYSRTIQAMDHAVNMMDDINTIHNKAMDNLEIVSEALQDLNENQLSSTKTNIAVRTLVQALDLATSIPSHVPVTVSFPIEHYFAIFAPLLFPLMVPVLLSWFRERKRYFEKITRQHQ